MDHGIDMEVTESIIMEDVNANIAKLPAVREPGVDIAIDDFGTGYSSLAYLRAAPRAGPEDRPDFRRNTMLDDASAMTLVLHDDLASPASKLTVVAEGVEQPEQSCMLPASLRCDQMQGFLFDALSFDEMIARLPSAAVPGSKCEQRLADDAEHTDLDSPTRVAKSGTHVPAPTAPPCLRPPRSAAEIGWPRVPFLAAVAGWTAAAVGALVLLAWALDLHAH